MPAADCSICLSSLSCNLCALPCTVFCSRLIQITVGGHVYHKECIRQFLTTGKRPVNRLCPSCRAPFDQPIALFFDNGASSSQLGAYDQQTTQDLPMRASIYQESTEEANEDVILPDISFYEENMTSLQHANSELSSNLVELERTLTVYKRRCEAHEEAKTELQRQVDELSLWLGRVRKSDAEKDKMIKRLSQEMEELQIELEEISEEKNALISENQHYLSLRVTDEYNIITLIF